MIRIWEKILSWALVLVLLFYLIGRAFMVPLVHDEAATFYHFIAYKKLFPAMGAQWLANNHIFNTISSYISVHYLGDTPFALRLPNLIAFVFYGLFSVKIAFKLKQPLLRWLLLVLLLLINSYIEFFSLCRGYGLMLMFFMGVLWFMQKYFERLNIRDFSLASVLMVLAVYSNFTSLIPMLVLVVLALTKAFINKKNSVKVLIVSILLLLAIFPAVLMLMEMKTRGLLWYGGSEGLFKDTLGSLQNLIFDTDSHFLGLSILMIMLFLSIYLINQFAIYGSAAIKSKNIYGFVLVVVLIGLKLSNLFLGIKFPEDRTGLYLIPLFVCALVFWLDQIYFSKILVNLVSAVSIISIAVFFFININFTHSTFWKNERLPFEFYSHLLKSQQSQKATIGGYVIQELCWSYLNFEKESNISLLDFYDYPNTLQDFQLVNKKDTSLWDVDYKTIITDSISGLSLLERKQPLMREFYLNLIDSQEIHIQSEFKDLAGVELYSVQDSLLFEIQANVYSESLLRMWCILELKDSTDEKLLYRRIPLNWKRRVWNGEVFHEFLTLVDIPDESKYVKLYLWNLDKTPCVLREVKSNLWHLAK